MTLTRLIILPRREGQAAAYRIVDGAGVLERGALGGAPAPHGDLPTVLVVPGADVLCRWLDLPPGQDVQVAAAAAVLLEDDLATPREQLHVALGRAQAGRPRLVALVDRARMQGWLDQAAALGVSPVAVCPDHLLAAEPETDEILAAPDGDMVILRGPELAVSCEPELLEAVVGARPCRLVGSPAEAERLLSFNAARPPVDLLQGAFGRRDAGPSRSARGRIAILAGLAIVALLALPVVQAVRHELAARAASARVRIVAGLPSTASPDEALTGLRARVARVRAAEAFPGVASALFAAIEGVEGMELQSLLYGPDGILRATLNHVNYSDVELLRRALGRSGLAVEEKSAVVDQGRVLSDILIRSRP